ncbi:MAG: hypothetical protein WC623_21625 [Pedobacter sp.]|uniref:hypothetical protein n=1 Tax=Pedobacter sp. TaxID=1411316 RepID=UPI0035678EBA
MRLIIKNAKTVYVTPASESHHLDIDIEEIETDELLSHIDIVTAIEYYGMTELLDTIGEAHLKSHLEGLKAGLT